MFRAIFIAFLFMLAAPSASARDRLGAWVHAQHIGILAALEDDLDAVAAEARAREVLAAVAFHGTASDDDAWREAAFLARLTGQLAQLGPAERRAVISARREVPGAVRALAFQIGERDDVDAAYRLLLDVLEAHGTKQVGRYANLAAALCVVHDAGVVSRRVNENAVVGPEALDVFGYLVSHDRDTLWGVAGTPPGMLVYVVDAAAPVSELRWAMGKHRGDRKIGDRYHQINYDTRHLKQGTPKRITEEGFSLPNIARFGGVCVDQAYYAEHAGKSIGVPTVSITGRGSESGHCWVGFVERRGNTLRWNFDEGRYDEYEKLRGVLDDPQSGEVISSDELAIRLAFDAAPRSEREHAQALADGAAFVLEGTPPPPAPAEVARLLRAPRPVGVDGALQLARESLGVNAGTRDAWALARRVFEGPEASVRERRGWSAAALNIAGRESPYFALDQIRAIIAGMPNAQDRAQLWAWVAKRMRTWPMITAEARLSEAQAWSDAGDQHRAWMMYETILRDHVDDGQAVVHAALAMARMLRVSGRGDMVDSALGDAWRRIPRPSPGGVLFVRSSNWYRVGGAYASALERAGRLRDAESIRRQLDSVVRGETIGRP